MIIMTLTFFFRYGWPIDKTVEILPESSLSNHPSMISFYEHVDYNATELGHGAIDGPFIRNPLPCPLICSPLQTMPKCGSPRQHATDLSFHPSRSVNSCIPDNFYLDKHFKLQLLGIAILYLSYNMAGVAQVAEVV